MDMDGVESCSICMESYDDDVRPRCLPCGHNFCGACLTNSIKNGRLQCPHCQKIHDAHSDNDFPINYGMEALISQIRKLKLGAIPKYQPERECRPLQPGSKWQEVFNDQIDSLRNLIRISEEAELDISHYKTFIHQRKAKHEHLRSQIHELDKRNEEIIRQFEAEDKALTDILIEGKEHKKRVAGTLSRYEQVTSAQEFAIGSDEVATCCNTLEEWRRRSQMQLPNAKIIRISDKIVKQTTTVLEEILLDDDEDAKGSLDLSVSISPIMEKLFRIRGIVAMPLKDLQAKSESVLILLKKRLVYGVQNKGLDFRTAMLSTENNRIYLHCLKHEELPVNSRTIQHSELIESLDKDSVSVFMDLSWEGSVRGRLHILLSPDTPLARHFRLLCCGDLGPSYFQSQFHDVWDRGDEINEWVFGGDYEYSDGSGGAPLMNGVNPMDRIYERKGESGILWAINSENDGPKISQFVILTGKGHNSTYYRVFGRVQEGLEIVREAAQLDDIHQVSIADCGVVLPY